MFNTLVGIGVILTQVALVVTIIGWIVKAPFVRVIATHASMTIAIIFTGAALGSFIYQYGFGYEPCLLCWYQRIAIFPIAFLAWTANIRSNRLLQNQVFWLALVGFLIAALHVYIDVFPSGLDICGATGPSCLMRYVNVFGYVTIPMMSFTVLASGILLVLLARYYPQEPIA